MNNNSLVNSLPKRIDNLFAANLYDLADTVEEDLDHCNVDKVYDMFAEFMGNPNIYIKDEAHAKLAIESPPDFKIRPNRIDPIIQAQRVQSGQHGCPIFHGNHVWGLVDREAQHLSDGIGLFLFGFFVAITFFPYLIDNFLVLVHIYLSFFSLPLDWQVIVAIVHICICNPVGHLIDTRLKRCPYATKCRLQIRGDGRNQG